MNIIRCWLLLFTILLVTQIAEGGRQDLLQMLQKKREGKGIKNDRLTEYCRKLENKSKDILKGLQYVDPDDIKSYYFANNIAAIVNSTNPPKMKSEGAEYSTEFLTQIVDNLMRYAYYSRIIVDEAYTNVAICFQEVKGSLYYALVFSIDQDTLLKQMPQRFREIRAQHKFNLANYDRLSPEADEQLCNWAKRIRLNVSETHRPDGFDPEIHTVVNVQVPLAQTVSWNPIVNYLASEEYTDTHAAILDSANLKMGISWNWNFPVLKKRQENPEGYLHIVVVFEKMRKFGTNSFYQPVLEKIANRMKEVNKVKRDLILTLDPKLNEKAESMAIRYGYGGNGDDRGERIIRQCSTSETMTGVFGQQVFKTEATNDELNVLEGILESVISGAQIGKIVGKQGNAKKLNTHIGFGSAVVKDSFTGNVNWNFFVLFDV